MTALVLAAWCLIAVTIVAVYARAARHRKAVLAARGRYSAEALGIARQAIAARQQQAAQR